MTWANENAAWMRAAEVWWPSKVEPLRVTFRMADEVAWDDRNGMTALEGALQWQVVARATGRTPSDVFAGCVGKPRIPIPVEHVEIAGRQIACCSWGIPAQRVDGVRWIRKRARVETLNLKRVPINMGAYKSLQFPIATVVTPFLHFFVRGDRDKLGELLGDVVGLARGRGSSIGVVDAWAIDDDPDDRSLVYQGHPQRALPLTTGGDFDPLHYVAGSFERRETTTRAPYWKRWDDVAMCAVPTALRPAE